MGTKEPTMTATETARLRSADLRRAADEIGPLTTAQVFEHAARLAPSAPMRSSAGDPGGGASQAMSTPEAEDVQELRERIAVLETALASLGFRDVQDLDAPPLAGPGELTCDIAFQPPPDAPFGPLPPLRICRRRRHHHGLCWPMVPESAPDPDAPVPPAAPPTPTALEAAHAAGRAAGWEEAIAAALTICREEAEWWRKCYRLGAGPEVHAVEKVAARIRERVGILSPLYQAAIK